MGEAWFVKKVRLRKAAQSVRAESRGLKGLRPPCSEWLQTLQPSPLSLQQDLPLVEHSKACSVQTARAAKAQYNVCSILFVRDGPCNGSVSMHFEITARARAGGCVGGWGEGE